MVALLVSEYRHVLQDVLAVGVCLAAFIWGGGPERVVAATWLIVFELGGRLYRGLFSDGFRLLEVDPFLASADLSAGAIWILVALYANRIYPLWIAGTQILAIAAHLSRALAESVSPLAYATMFIAPGWIQLVLLGAGVLRHALRVRRHGEYRDWRTGPGGAPLPLVAFAGRAKRALLGKATGLVGGRR